MSMLQFSLNDYIAYVFMSHTKRLLVEGSDDSRLFNRLFDIFDKNRKLVDVDDASQLIGFNHSSNIPVKNREKVELVCSSIRNTTYSEKLVGFVDREYRGFLFAPNLIDEISHHYVDGRLVWTRGHSIENYFFEFETLRVPISTLTTTRYYHNALDLFEKNFETVVRLACAASLTGMELTNYQVIRSAITWDMFDLDNGDLSFNLSQLESTLLSRNVPEPIITQILTRFPYWETLTFSADFDIVRWMCHGHMGLSFIWFSFMRMVFEASKSDGNQRPVSDVSHTLEVKDEIRFNACANKWIERSLGNASVFPYEVLKMLNLMN